MVKILGRYSRNIKTLTVEENESLKNFKVSVVGCGGIGGYVIEMLGRLGIGKIIAIDYDVFEESNLNRQILSDSNSLGTKKVEKAQERMKAVNPHIEVQAINERLTDVNGEGILRNSDVVIDALDSIESRLMLEKLCEKLHIPLVHGAIGGWYGQVSTVLPGDRTISRFYGKNVSEGIEKKLGNPSFTPALVASIEVSEVIKLLIKRGDLLRNKILFIDLLEQEYQVIEL